MWDPTAKRVPVVRELECSRDAEGVAQATVTLTPWGTRERLAYQDGALDAVKYDVTEDGNATMRRVSVAAMSLLHLRLTVTACTGFPDQYEDHADPAYDRVPVPFSFGNPEHVKSLDVDVFEEVLAHAKDVQPADGKPVRKPEDRKPPAAKGEPSEDFDEGDAADPTPARSTRGARPRR